MQRMKSNAFLVAYVLCESLLRGPEYIDAITDPQTYRHGTETDIPDTSPDTPDFDCCNAPAPAL